MFQHTVATTSTNDGWAGCCINVMDPASVFTCLLPLHRTFAALIQAAALRQDPDGRGEHDALQAPQSPVVKPPPILGMPCIFLEKTFRPAVLDEGPRAR